MKLLKERVYKEIKELLRVGADDISEGHISVLDEIWDTLTPNGIFCRFGGDDDWEVAARAQMMLGAFAYRMEIRKRQAANQQLMRRDDTRSVDRTTKHYIKPSVQQVYLELISFVFDEACIQYAEAHGFFKELSGKLVPTFDLCFHREAVLREASLDEILTWWNVLYPERHINSMSTFQSRCRRALSGVKKNRGVDRDWQFGRELLARYADAEALRQRRKRLLCLAGLVAEVDYISICVSPGGANASQKRSWESIANRYNQVYGASHTPAELRQKYYDAKRATRKYGPREHFKEITFEGLRQSCEIGDAAAVEALLDEQPDDRYLFAFAIRAAQKDASKD